jgi:hypothetical protein
MIRLRDLSLLAVCLLVAGCSAELAERNPSRDPASASAEEAPPPPPIHFDGHDPILAVTPTAEPGTPPSVATLYTCRMHPDVHSATAGRCPKCNMKLVPVEGDK